MHERRCPGLSVSLTTDKAQCWEQTRVLTVLGSIPLASNMLQEDFPAPRFCSISDHGRQGVNRDPPHRWSLLQGAPWAYLPPRELAARGRYESKVQPSVGQSQGGNEDRFTWSGGIHAQSKALQKVFVLYPLKMLWDGKSKANKFEAHCKVLQGQNPGQKGWKWACDITSLPEQMPHRLKWCKEWEKQPKCQRWLVQMECCQMPGWAPCSAEDHLQKPAPVQGFCWLVQTRAVPQPTGCRQPSQMGVFQPPQKIWAPQQQPHALLSSTGCFPNPALKSRLLSPDWHKRGLSCWALLVSIGFRANWVFPFRMMVIHWSQVKTLYFRIGNFQSPVCLGAMTLQGLCPITQQHTRHLGHPTVRSSMQLAGKKSTTSIQEMYRQIIKKQSKHTLAQPCVKAVRANTSHCVSAAFDRALIRSFYSALTLFYQVLVCTRFF